jgi:hypothetical protein
MRAFGLSLVLIAGGCAQLQGFVPGGPRAPSEPAEEVAAIAAAPAPPPGARTAEEFDTTTEAQRAAATSAAPAPEERLGQVVASLGDPAAAGIWMETDLVDAPRSGRVVAEGGSDALVELRPGSGGARLSLAAMRLLQVPLTGLPTVTVYGR